MDAATLELKTALASLFECGKFSDLTIVCGSKRYSVHRALLATRSSFFDGACRDGFKEAESRVIDLTEDDAEAVEHMIHYFYHLDYLNKSTTRTSPRSSQPTSPITPMSPRLFRRTVPKKLNLALIEDPLLAQIAGAGNAAMPLTPPAEEEMFQHLDAFSKKPDLSIVDPYPVDDDVESVLSEPEMDTETPHLVTHAKVYAIAEKYSIAGLKALARNKFVQELDLHLNSPEFPEACQEAYESTFHTDRGLRDVIIQTFRANPDLSLRSDVEEIVRETPGLAFELFRMASGLPVAS